MTADTTPTGAPATDAPMRTSTVSKRMSSGVTLFAILGVVTLVWIFAVPPSAGPDEPGHHVRGAALVRGQLDGEWLPAASLPAFELPAEVGFPDPGCFAFQPNVPASCANGLTIPDGDALLFTKSSDYPVWGHVPPGIGTLVPGAANRWAARITDAIIPVLLLGASLLIAARRGALPAMATLLAITPLAWFIVAVVNPSGPVIAGGVGLWTAFVALTDSPGRPPNRGHRLVPWLAVLSWTAMVLPRRDGLVYAALILAGAILVLDLDLRGAARRIGNSKLAIAGAATTATLLWAARSNTVGSLALFAAPIAPIGALALRTAAARLSTRSLRQRLAASAFLGIVTALGVLFVMSRRTGGFDRATLRDAVGQTGLNLNEAIGVLGWDDTPVPTSAVYLWIAALGALVAVAVVAGARRLLAGTAAVLLVAIVASWTLTMLQNSTGLYWQGRYYLPLLVGLPILLGTVRLDAAAARRVGLFVGSASMVVVNLALAGTMRRFGVGVEGSFVPTDWNTYDTPVPPAILLVVHAVASVGLVGWLLRRSDDAVAATPGINIVGYHQAASGLGEIAREIHRSLDAAGVPCTAIDIAATDSPLHRPPHPVPTTLHDNTLVVAAALQTPSIMAELPTVRAAQNRTVGYWFWELSTVPDSHQQAIDLVDEVWAPTEFVRDAYADRVDQTVTPILLRPTSIPRPSVSQSDVARWRSELTGSPDDVLFVVSFDLFSVVERKNPFGAIDAFTQAFGNGKRNVRLVIKTMNGDQRPDDLQWIRDETANDSRITVVDRYVSDSELDALISAADVYVSLHRSEGLGLQLATAMWLGTPVIATRWSGNLDLMDDSCAALVDAQLVAVANGHGAYPSSAVWADPDIDQAADWMRRLATDPDLAAELAAAARDRMENQPSRAEIGRAMWTAIDAPTAVR